MGIDFSQYIYLFRMEYLIWTDFSQYIYMFRIEIWREYSVNTQVPDLEWF